eukprot:scaffold8.g1549.t1
MLPLLMDAAHAALQEQAVAAARTLLAALEGMGPTDVVTLADGSRLAAESGSAVVAAVAAGGAAGGAATAAAMPIWLWLLVGCSAGLGAAIHAAHWLVHKRVVEVIHAAQLEVAVDDNKENIGVQTVLSMAENATTSPPPVPLPAVRPLRDTLLLPPKSKGDPEELAPGSPMPGPQALPVDGSVRARDIGALGWAPAQSSEANKDLPGSGAAAKLSRMEGEAGSFSLGGIAARLSSADMQLDGMAPPPGPLLLAQEMAGATSIEPRDARLEAQLDAAAGAARAASGSSSGEQAAATAPSSERESEANPPGASPRSSSLAASPQQQQLCQSDCPAARELTREQFERDVRLGTLLGAGGAGSVMKAVWEGRPVAVKCLHPSLQADARAVASFQREVELMAVMGGHPSILPVLAYCREPPHCCIISPLMEGSLHSLMERGLRPRYGTLLSIAEDVAAALHHCHSASPAVLHRDLKPENVLFARDSRSCVADWGLARQKRRSCVTLDGTAQGTPEYCAPEVFAGAKVDEKSDVFSYGMLLWALLCGRHPWEELDSPLQIVWAVGVQQRRPQLPDGCPAHLATLIQMCWRQSPQLRPSFADILHRRLPQIRAADTFAALSVPRASPVLSSPSARKVRLEPLTPAPALLS